MKRRQFLQHTAVAAASTALASITACSDGDVMPRAPLAYKPGKPIPWTNWAGNQACLPAHRFAPASEDELLQTLKAAQGVVRAVGAGHSFSAVVPTDDTLVSTDLLSGLVSHDAETMQATVLAGTRLHALGPLLESVGQALPNMPDMDYPSIGGAVANSVHATGNEFGSMCAYVTGMKLATPGGELIECSRDKNAEIFQAARTSVGSLGISTEISLQNRTPFDLTEVNRVELLDDVFDQMDQRCKEHRYFECYLVPYSDLCLTVATDFAKPEDKNIGEDDVYAVNSLRALFKSVSWLPVVGDAVYDKLLSAFISGESSTVRTGRSYQVLPHVRVVRFREMEYTVPAELGMQCGREILETIKRKKLPLSFPIEYRYVKADDIWLSMFEGQDGCSISIHQYGDVDYKKVFAEIEPIFHKYGGRPHWGKIHTLGAKQLAALYPKHWQDFQEVRKSLDPDGKMLNDHLRDLFGVA